MKVTYASIAASLVLIVVTLAVRPGVGAEPQKPDLPAAAQAKAKEDALAAEIKKLDEAERAAVLANDVPAIEKYWAEDLTVNAPNNQVLKGGTNALDLVRNGILDYGMFERVVEEVLVYGDTVILMGSETIRPRGKAPFAGQTIHRRFTNIWIKRKGEWKLTARHASIIPEK
jgi:ketosteroid isomerase-like protein